MAGRPDTRTPFHDVENAVRTLLAYVGADSSSDGLKDTPGRVARALYEMTGGYGEDPATILSRTFEAEHDEMIVVSGIRFTSLCEHHLLPFIGTADVGYLPDGRRIVGLSKLARLVECFAKRLQVQERLANQIADAIVDHLGAKGAAVVIRAKHCCMGCRGVRQPDATMTTSVLRGALKKPAARAEFLSLCEVAQ